MSKVLIRIKSYEEIEKGLSIHKRATSPIYGFQCDYFFVESMKKYCGKTLLAEKGEHGDYFSENYFWHPNWAEVISDTEQEEAEMLEMLSYFLNEGGVA